MKKVALLLVLLFTLIACQSRITSTPIEVSPTPSRTPTTITPTALPTITLVQTPIPVSTIGHLASEYVLVTPAPELLVPIALQAVIQKAELSTRDELQPVEPFAQEDAMALYRALDFEWSRTYSNSFSDPVSLLKTLRADNRVWWSSADPQMNFDLLSDITVNYINQEAIQLHNEVNIHSENFGFDAKVYAVEIDNDIEPEWLVKANFEQYHNGIWLTLNHTEQGYVRLLNEIANETVFPGIEGTVNRLEDLNGDSLTDAVIILNYYSAGLAVHGFQLLRGTPEGFQLVSNIDASEASPSQENYYTWITSDDNKPVLKIETRRYFPWGCETKDYIYYKWGNNDRIEIESGAPEIPENAYCAIAQATDSFYHASLETQIHFLELALEDAENSQLTDEVLVYIHYRLALSYALEGNDVLTRYHIKSISDMAATGTSEIAVHLTEQLSSLLAEPKILPYPLCQLAQAIALPPIFVGGGMGRDYYPYEGLPEDYPYPTPLCEIDFFPQTVLNELDFDPNHLTEDVLKAAGLPVLLIQPISLGEPASAWLIILHETIPAFRYERTISSTHNRLAIYGYLDGTGWNYIGHFSPDSKMEWINQDLTDDGQSELAMDVQESAFSSCETNQITHYIFIVSAVGNGWIFNQSGVVCQNEGATFSLIELLKDADGDGLSDWFVEQFSSKYDFGLLENYPPPRPLIFNGWDAIVPLTSIPDILTALDEQFFTSPTPSLLRPEIESYRTRWGMGDDPTSAQIYAHLTYLLALTYELEGDEPQAVALFYDIWANHPDTLWAYLAAARLELK